MIKLSATGGGAAIGPAVVDLAGQFAQGRIGSTRTALANDVRIESLHARVEADLRSLQKRAEEHVSELRARVDMAKKPADDATLEANNARKNLDEAVRAVQDNQRKINEVLKNELEQQTTTQNSTRQLESLVRAREGLENAERAARDRLQAVTARETQNRDALDIAKQELRQFGTSMIREVRQLLEVHRRVIAALREAQVP